MAVRPGQEQTKAVAIPEDWTESQLGAHLATQIRNGYSPVCPDSPTGIWILSLAAVTRYGFSSAGVKPAPLGDGAVLDNLLEAGDIVVSRSNTPDRVGLAGLYQGDPRPCAYPDLIMRVRPAQTLSARYLLFHLLSSRGRQYFRMSARGSSSSMVKIDRSILEAFPLPLPPTKAEQEAIAHALSDADALIESLDQLIAKKRHIKQGAMQELLTGKRRLPGLKAKPGYRKTDVGVIPEDWAVEYVEELLEITTGSKNTQDRIEDGLYPFFVRSQTVERINSYSFDGEAVLTAGDGVGTGKVYHYVDGRFDVHQRVYRMTSFGDRLDGYYFFLCFSSLFYARIMQMTAKSSVDSVRREMIARMQIPLPKKAEQEAIAEVLSDIDAEIAALDTRLDKARQVKQGMMHNLLTGRIRLI